MRHEEGQIDERRQEEQLGHQQLGPFVRSRDPELRVAHQSFRMDDAGDQEPPADGNQSHKQDECLFEIIGDIDGTAGTEFGHWINGLNVRVDTDTGGDQRQQDGNLNPKAANVFDKNMQDLFHATFS